MNILPYFVGEVSKLQSYGIDTDGLRKSLTGTVTEQEIDGEIAVSDTRLAIVHQHLLTPEQIRAIRFDPDVKWYFGDEATSLVQGEEWADSEI